MNMRGWVLGLMLGLIAFRSAGNLAGQTVAAKEQEPTVTVVITSDNQTWVSLTNFKQPSKFKALRLQLPPGVYEIVGRRRGYRDEMQSLVVREGWPSINVSMICTVSVHGDSR